MGFNRGDIVTVNLNPKKGHEVGKTRPAIIISNDDENKIDVLNTMEVGINFDTAPRAMDLSLYSTFDSKEDLNTYAVHPEHLKVVEKIKEVTLSSKVSDYII